MQTVSSLIPSILASSEFTLFCFTSAHFLTGIHFLDREIQRMNILDSMRNQKIVGFLEYAPDKNLFV